MTEVVHAGGVVVTLVGHPFDTLKVRLQTQSHTKPIYCEPRTQHQGFYTWPCT